MNTATVKPATMNPAASPQGEAFLGETVADRYRVVGLLGAGGMGTVFEVEHLELGSHFALKLMRLDRWDSDLLARFRREARALARLRTPRVAQVTDFGSDARFGPYYVMELVQGEPLDRILKRDGPIPPEQALRLASGIADALADVHAAGLVHRDIKPSNIAIGSGPIPVRLMDFGLAAIIDDSLISRLTQSQQVVGSLPYMAPEQFHGEPTTPAVDLWGLGVVFYEMLTGRPPFHAPSTAALIHYILTTPPPLAERVDATLEPLLGCMLAKDPALRIQSAAELAAVLRSAAVVEPLSLVGVDASTSPAHPLPPVSPATGPVPPAHRASPAGSVGATDTVAVDSGFRNTRRALISHGKEEVASPSRSRLVPALLVLVGLLASALIWIGWSLASGSAHVASPPPAPARPSKAGVERELAAGNAPPQRDAREVLLGISPGASSAIPDVPQEDTTPASPKSRPESAPEISRLESGVESSRAGLERHARTLRPSRRVTSRRPTLRQRRPSMAASPEGRDPTTGESNSSEQAESETPTPASSMGWSGGLIETPAY